MNFLSMYPIHGGDEILALSEIGFSTRFCFGPGESLISKLSQVHNMNFIYENCYMKARIVVFGLEDMLE